MIEFVQTSVGGLTVTAVALLALVVVLLGGIRQKEKIIQRQREKLLQQQKQLHQ